MKFTFDDEVKGYLGMAKAVERLIPVLDALPDGKLISVDRLAELAKYSVYHVQRVARLSVFKDYSHLVGHKRWFGNKKTIKGAQSL